MHREQHRKEHPESAEDKKKTKEREQDYETVLSVLDEAHKEALNRFLDTLVADAAADNEFYYLAGFRDGIQLDWMVETMRKRKQEEP